ncbi:uncharacterized protein [Diadema antillarum]|uniref:uncharacterized protein n=1 Tax=Diadema antillarum TaxID=105358 RepID=UPI003A8626FB
MSLFRDFLDILLPTSDFRTLTRFQDKPCLFTDWKRYLSDSTRSCGYQTRKQEYYRQFVEIGGSSKPKAIMDSDGNHLYTKVHAEVWKSKARKKKSCKLDELERAKQFLRVRRRERNIVKESHAEGATQFRELFAVRRQITKLRHQLHEERKRTGSFRRKWEREFHRSNRITNEKRAEERKVGRLSNMVVRMRQMLISLEEENKNLKQDLDLALEGIDERKEDIEFLEVSLHQEQKMRRKLEKEFSSLLKDTADSDFQDLHELHFALLRKAPPCTQVDIAEKYEPLTDSNCSVITLGDGAFGRVFAYRQRCSRHGHGKMVAMKILHATDDDYNVKRQEILLEARLLKLVEDSGVFPLMFGVGSLKNDTAIAMEFLGDETTHDVMTLGSWTRKANLGVGHAKTVLSDLLSALTALHTNDILHNDIKDDNVVIKQSDYDMYSAYLIDLGNASTTFLPASYDFGAFERECYEQDPLTVHYAPELLFDSACTTTASDIYQVGQLIYFMAEDIGNAHLRDIAEECLYREPLSRVKLSQLMELVSKL